MNPTMRVGAWIVAFAMLVQTTPAGATEVRGTLEVAPSWLTALDQRTAAQPEQGPPTRFWEVGNGAASIDPPVIDMAQEFGIVVRRIDKQPLDPLTTVEPIIDVQNMAFQPAISFVAEGMSIKVQNLDMFDHDFVVEPEKGGAELPREELDGGRAFRVRFSASGLYVIRCRNFGFLRGYVLVEKDPVRFVHPADDGSFSLGNLPPGQYTLTVFNATAQASAAPTPAAGWVASPCPLDVPAEPPAAAEPPATPAEDPNVRRRPAETPPVAAVPPTPPPPPAPPVFRIALKLSAQGSTERVECPAGFPQAAAAPAAGRPGAPAQPPAAGGAR
jgi:plastocyanin